MGFEHRRGVDCESYREASLASLESFVKRLSGKLDRRLTDAVKMGVQQERKKRDRFGAKQVTCGHTANELGLENDRSRDEHFLWWQ